MSGLLHLVEAATVLTQLGPSTMRPSTAYQIQTTSSSSSSPTLRPTPRTNPHVAAISDDDETLATAWNTMAKLRESHLQALCAAAADVDAITTPTSSIESARTSMTSMATVYLDSSTAAAPKEMFPMRLHALLADSTVRDVITWLPHGKSFVVLRPDVFATDVLPRYFAPEGSNSLHSKVAIVAPKAIHFGGFVAHTKGVHKYPSFTRKLNRWGFRQISRGPDSGAFCHDLFQRDDPELCRGMVCQKSRKSKFRNSDDMMSVSSGSTMGTANKSIASLEKRKFSSTVTVSTAGIASNTSNLPLKKRKSGQLKPTDNYMMNDIPSMISHRYQKMSSSSSMTESDITSDNSSVSSNNNMISNNQNAVFELKLTKGIGSNTAQVSETSARETLAHHFHQQRRAFALASLQENSRLAMEAVGMNVSCESRPYKPASQQAIVRTSQNEVIREQAANHPAIGTVPVQSSVSLTHSLMEKNTALSVEDPSSCISVAESAKMALYKAYLQALNGNPLL